MPYKISDILNKTVRIFDGGYTTEVATRQMSLGAFLDKTNQQPPNELLQARFSGKKSEIYEKTKAKWANVMFSFNVNDLKKDKNASPTGLVPLDIDIEENADVCRATRPK